MLIPVKENIPGRKEFKTRFQKKLRGVAPLFEPIIDQLAEEAEKVIYQTWFETPEPLPQEPPSITVKLKSREHSARHYCRNCERQMIYPHHNFCPSCGISIKWIKK
jgi:predicted RNA-binding Zn-ribbon protein involved in translation (DUF1610 family)